MQKVHHALIDLDGTLADYDKAMREAQQRLASPGESPYGHRVPDQVEPDYMTARRKLIQGQTGFWRNLEPLPHGFAVLDEIRAVGFSPHILTKGPMKTLNAWSEKVAWTREYLPDALITIGSDKSLVYSRVLFDDFAPYFLGWLQHRPRGLVICLAHPWNESFRQGGRDEHPNVFRFDPDADGPKALEGLRARLKRAYERADREPL